jgi:hypothetical protein
MHSSTSIPTPPTTSSPSSTHSSPSPPSSFSPPSITPHEKSSDDKKEFVEINFSLRGNMFGDEIFSTGVNYLPLFRVVKEEKTEINRFILTDPQFADAYNLRIIL